MNILELNNKVHGSRELKQGEYANIVMESIEQKEMLKINFENNETNNDFNKINKEIKF